MEDTTGGGKDRDGSETLAEDAVRIKAEVLAASFAAASPEEIHSLAEMVRELYRIEALIGERRD